MKYYPIVIEEGMIEFANLSVQQKIQKKYWNLRTTFWEDSW